MGSRFVSIRRTKRVAQNSGIRYDALDENGEYTTYYGFIYEIWELEYGVNFQISCFSMPWG